MADTEQLTTQTNSLQDIASYYEDAAQGAHSLLKNAVMVAADDFVELHQNLRAVNAYIKAKDGIGRFMEKVVESQEPEMVWDPFAAESSLETRLQVVQAKAEFTSVSASESSAVALYQAGLSYDDIVEHTGMKKKDIQKMVRGKKVKRKNPKKSKSVPIVK
tara:strand:+ start:1659 stop:2141 length:483 start_codon:yes stop_codon:yes gene_type:complete